MEAECADIAFVFLFQPGEARAATYCNTVTFIWLPWQLTDERRYRSNWTRQRKQLPFLEAEQSLSIVCSLMSPPHLDFSPPLSFPSSSHSLLSLLIVHHPFSVSTATLGCFSIAHVPFIVRSGLSPSSIHWYPPPQLAVSPSPPDPWQITCIFR